MPCTFSRFNNRVMQQDTRWDLWYKILCQYQTRTNANPANDPNIADTLWDLKRKIAKAASEA